MYKTTLLVLLCFVVTADELGAAKPGVMRKVWSFTAPPAAQH